LPVAKVYEEVAEMLGPSDTHMIASARRRTEAVVIAASED
jgi:hypothetical protein